MKPEEQKILNDSISKLFKIEPETLASLYNEAGDLVDFSAILDLDAKRIAKYKSESDNQYKRGIKEGATKIESAIKEKYELESDLVGVDLVDHLLVKKTEEAKTATTKDITKHPDYIKLQVTIDKQLAQRDKEWEQKLVAKETEFHRAQTFEKVSKRGLANLKKRNPIMPADPTKAQYWEDTYINELRKRNYLENGEDIVVLDEENKPLQNDHGNPITFDQFTNGIADKIFEFPKSTERSSSSLKDKEGQQQQSPFPKSEDDRLQMLRDPKITPQRRKELTEFVIK